MEEGGKKSMKKEVLIVDGYNMIGAWPELIRLKNQDKMDAARDHLLLQLSNYSKYEGVETRVVFDAQLVPGIQKNYTRFSLEVIFTKQGETADSYIERTVGEENLLITQVSVATSDMAEQMMIFQKGASRISARELHKRVTELKKQYSKEYLSKQTHRPVRSSLSEKDMKNLWALYDELVTPSSPKKGAKKKKHKE